MFPARGERIERKASPEIHHGHDRPTIGFQYLASRAKNAPADYTRGDEEHDGSEQGVSSSPSCPAPVRRSMISDARHLLLSHMASLARTM